MIKLIAIFLSIFLSGCGTLATRMLSDTYAEEDVPDVRIYSGTVFDVACLSADNVGFFCLLDLPLSLAVDTLFLPITIYEQFFTGRLHKEVVNGNVNRVKEMLDQSTDVNTKDVYGHTPLMSAAWGGHISIVEALLEKGAEVNAKAKYNRTALMYAVARDHSTIVKILLDSGSNINAKDTEGNTALRIAIVKGRTSAARVLLDRGADPNEIGGKYRNTLLMDAAWLGRTAIARALLEKGADPNGKDADGDTPLKLAAKGGHEEITRLLRSVGANEDN